MSLAEHITNRYAAGETGLPTRRTLAALAIVAGTITASDAFSITQTWNNGSETFVAQDVNVTDTASAAGSLLARWRVAGSAVAYIDKAGVISGSALRAASGGSYAQLTHDGTNAVLSTSAGALSFSQRALFGTGTDDGVNQVQVNGSLSAAGLISANGGSAGNPSLTTAYQLSVGTDLVLGSTYGVVVGSTRIAAFTSSSVSIAGALSVTSAFPLTLNTSDASGLYTLWQRGGVNKAFIGSGKQLNAALSADDFAIDANAGNLYFLTAGTSRGFVSSTGLNACAIGADMPSTGAFTTGSFSDNVGLTKSSNGVVSYTVTNANAGGSTEADFVATNGTASVYFGMYGTAGTTVGVFQAGRGFVHASAAGGLAIAASHASGTISVAAGGTAQVGQFTATGLNSCAIGVSSPSTGAFTTGAFSSGITMTGATELLTATAAGTNYKSLRIGNTGGLAILGVESSTGGSIIIGSTAYDTALRGTAGISFSADDGLTVHARITSTGLTVAGSSSAEQFVTNQGASAYGGVRFSSGRSDADSRDWAVGTNYHSFGDWVLRVSTAKDGNPFSAGATILSATASGLSVTGTGAFSSTVNITPGDAADALNLASWMALSYTGNTLRIGNSESAGEWTGISTYIGGNAITTVTSTGLSVTGSVIASSLVKGVALLAVRAGSDTPGSGPYVYIANADESRRWFHQLNASNNLRVIHYSGSYATIAEWTPTGLAVTGGLSAVVSGGTANPGNAFWFSDNSASCAAYIRQNGAGDVLAGSIGATEVFRFSATGLAISAGSITEKVYEPAASTAQTVDLANGSIQKFATSGNFTATLPATSAGKSFVVQIVYGGAHTLTWAGATIKWAGGVAPVATSVSGKIDIFAFFQDGTNTYGSVIGQNF